MYDEFGDIVEKPAKSKSVSFHVDKYTEEKY